MITTEFDIVRKDCYQYYINRNNYYVFYTNRAYVRGLCLFRFYKIISMRFINGKRIHESSDDRKSIYLKYTTFCTL